jgi:hypothetical protein
MLSSFLERITKQVKQSGYGKEKMLLLIFRTRSKWQRKDSRESPFEILIQGYASLSRS